MELLKWCVVKDGGTKRAIAWLKSDVFGCGVIRVELPWLVLVLNLTEPRTTWKKSFGACLWGIALVALVGLPSVDGTIPVIVGVIDCIKSRKGAEEASTPLIPDCDYDVTGCIKLLMP